MRYDLCFVCLTFLPFVASADVVKVYEETACGASVVQVAERMLETGRSYKTDAAPAKSGWIFTHWTISTSQEFNDRDDWGRAFDEAPFKLYENTTLTAHYLPATQDEDGDGLADGHELYWYGSTDISPSSDTDGDGWTFAEEIANGTNPLMADADIAGPIRYADGVLTLYNPNNYGTITIRSDPEGMLFATVSEVYRPGTKVATTTKGTFDPNATTFAYWSFNGVRQEDAWGRALDSTEVLTDGRPLEIVAVTSDNKEQRLKLYWYGTTEVTMASDTDGDGFTFAEEVANGTNPLMADADIEGPVRYVDGALLQYNPWNLQPYTIRSEPEGALFATITDYARAGSALSSSRVGTFGATTARFAYWELNGVVQRDSWGRAVDQLDLHMPTNAVELVAIVVDDEEARQKIYWYGTTDVAMDSDTDGDGVSFVEEIARGTSPLMADGDIAGPVRYADSALHEANLQPYEQVTGAVVDEKYEEFSTFGGAVTPMVVDVDGDGKIDIVVEVAGGETVVYLGCGNEGNPEFNKVVWQAAWASALAAAKPRSLEGLEFDVNPPADTLSWSFVDVDGNGTEYLLISDSEGRIWYYRRVKDGNDGKDANDTNYQLLTLNYKLQHKVWGGSYAGFAQGLRIAAVDWDADGDLDCLCGTAEGKLMLLRDPKVGRPTNLKALVGIDNVRLDWDPNQQSRIRGYRVYRKDKNDTASWVPLSFKSFESFMSFTTPLPTYRDYPPMIGDYDYKVSSVSRFYTTGNSTPIESESPATEAVRATLGRVSLHWTDVVAKRGETFSLMLSIDNSMNVSPEGMAIDIEYDYEVLNLLKTVKSGLFEQDKIAPGSGKLYEYVFEVVSEEKDSDLTTEVRVKSATMYDLGGGKVTVAFPEKNATITIAAESSIAPYRLGDVNGDGLVDKDDLRELAKLKNAAGRKGTANQLKAGDFNGNGKLDNADYQALRAIIKEKGLL